MHVSTAASSLDAIPPISCRSKSMGLFQASRVVCCTCSATTSCQSPDGSSRAGPSERNNFSRRPPPLSPRTSPVVASIAVHVAPRTIPPRDPSTAPSGNQANKSPMAILLSDSPVTLRQALESYQVFADETTGVAWGRAQRDERMATGSARIRSVERPAIGWIPHRPGKTRRRGSQ